MNVFFLTVTLAVFVIKILVFARSDTLYHADNPEAVNTLGPGHLKRFGDGNPSHPIDEVTEFPDIETFFNEYVFPLKPLVMKGAAKLSPAFSLWEDEYFMTLDVPAGSQVLVENKKKENRTNPPSYMSLKEFVLVYNHTDQYMVESIPRYLRKDVILPGVLQCDKVEQHLVETIMWFSSGGTKSVVHTDSVDNINCLFRGEKDLVFVDPSKYEEKVDFDHPEGSYSGIDVDRVDYRKYPGLADVEYQHVHMSPGDCLYIPYEWIHQVRSTGRNIAVNVWWDHHKIQPENIGDCSSNTFNPSKTLDTLNYQGFSEILTNKQEVVNHILDITKVEKILTPEKFLKAVLMVDDAELEDMKKTLGMGFTLSVQGAFERLDKNGDNYVTHEEAAQSTEEDWNVIQKHILNVDILSKNIEDNPQPETTPGAVRDEL